MDDGVWAHRAALSQALNPEGYGAHFAAEYSYDSLADAAYVRVSSHASARQETHKATIIVDYDKTGQLVGIEILDLLPEAADAERMAS